MKDKSIRVRNEYASEDLQDIWSALAFFISDYPDKKGSLHTRKAMAKIIVKTRLKIEAQEKKK